MDEIVYHGDGFCRSCTEGRIAKLKQRIKELEDQSANAARQKTYIGPAEKAINDQVSGRVR